METQFPEEPIDQPDLGETQSVDSLDPRISQSPEEQARQMRAHLIDLEKEAQELRETLEELIQRTEEGEPISPELKAQIKASLHQAETELYDLRSRVKPDQ